MSVAIATIPPCDNTITNLSNRTLDGIFNSQHGGLQHKWEIEHIVKLLNHIGSDHRIPVDIRGSWGDSVKAIASAQAAVHGIDVRGDTTNDQNKQITMSSAMVLDNNKQLNDVALHNEPFLSNQNEPFLEDEDHIDLKTTATSTSSPPTESLDSVTRMLSKLSVVSQSAETGNSAPEPEPVTVAQHKTESHSPPHSLSGSTTESTEKAAPSLLWKGTIIHNEPLKGNEEQNELCFGIKIYHLGGEFIYKLPGFAAPDEKKGKKKRNKMLMTGRIEHIELERYLLKSLQNESRKLICCKIAISKEIAEAQKLVKHLKRNERCARFKVGSKRNATFFDFYIVPPTKSNRYLNHQFVAQHFGATISSKKMWAVIVLPIQSFNAVHEKPTGHSHQSQGHRHRKKVKHTPESVLDEHFFRILDGLESVLGVDTQPPQDPKEQSNAANVSSIPSSHQSVQPVVVPEVPSDPRKRR